MFDKNSYPAKLIQTSNALDKVRLEYFNKISSPVNYGKEKFDKINSEYKQKIIKAEKAFAKEHDKYCDQINAPHMKITENWKQWW